MWRIRCVYLMGLARRTPAVARLELMVSVVNGVLEERTAPSHILMRTRQYKAGEEPPIAVGMTPIRLLMIYIGRVAIWHRSLGIWHSMRWHHTVVTTLIREVLPRPMKGVKIPPPQFDRTCPPSRRGSVVRRLIRCTVRLPPDCQ